MDDSLSVYIVEDQTDTAQALQAGLQSLGIVSRLFLTAEALLKDGSIDNAACLILDIGLPGMSGLDLQSELRRASCRVPIVIISGSATVSDAVRAFEVGAAALFEKPFDVQRLLDTTQKIVAAELERRDQQNEQNRRLAKLSPRESEVMEQLIAGKGVKSISRDLGISASTAEKHRANVLVKTGFDSVIELTYFLLSNGARQPAMANFARHRFDQPSASAPRRQLTAAHLRAARA